jgi:nitroreductase
MDRPADTAAPLHELIRQRWSPRAFAPREITREQIATLLEAARWAASSSNEQPWRFIVAPRADAALFERVLACLVPANQVWARNAPVLMLSLAHTLFARNGKKNAHAWHDVGLAMSNLTIQAMSMGIFVHQMAGIEPPKIREAFALPPEVEPVAAIALGYPGEPSQLPKELAERELAPRTRRPLRETVFGARFGEGSPLVG